MKRSFLIIAFILPTHFIVACPLCVGRISTESKPFFTDEYYQQQEQTNAPNVTDSQKLSEVSQIEWLKQLLGDKQ